MQVATTTTTNVGEFPEEIKRGFAAFGIDDTKIAELIKKYEENAESYIAEKKRKKKQKHKISRAQEIINKYKQSGYSDRDRNLPAIVYEIIEYYENIDKNAPPQEEVLVQSVQFIDDEDEELSSLLCTKRQRVHQDDDDDDVVLKKVVSWCSLTRLAMCRVLTQMVFQLSGGSDLMNTFLRAIAEHETLTIDYVRQFIDNSSLFDRVLENWATAKSSRRTDFRTCILRALVPNTDGEEQRFARSVNEILESDNIYHMISTLVDITLPINKAFLEKAFTATPLNITVPRDFSAEFEFKTCIALFYKIASMMENLVATAKQEHPGHVIPSFLFQSTTATLQRQEEEFDNSPLVPMDHNSSLLSMNPIWNLID